MNGHLSGQRGMHLNYGGTVHQGNLGLLSRLGNDGPGRRGLLRRQDNRPRASLNDPRFGVGHRRQRWPQNPGMVQG